MTTVYVDLDDTICNYSGRYRELKHKLMPYPQQYHWFYSGVIPMEGAVKSLDMLMKDDLVDLYILTAPSTPNLSTYTGKAKWVKDNLGEEYLENMIICSDKSLLRGDILVDNNIKGKGQENFKGILIKHTNWLDTLHKIYLEIWGLALRTLEFTT